MPEQQEIAESVVKADRWSKVIATFVAIGTFFGVSLVVDEALFSMIVAAFVGIGTRIYIPYHASISTSDPDHQPIQAYEDTGNYHQGAAGAAVVVGVIVAVNVMIAYGNSSLALLAGAAGGVVAFLGLKRYLPS